MAFSINGGNGSKSHPILNFSASDLVGTEFYLPSPVLSPRNMEIENLSLKLLDSVISVFQEYKGEMLISTRGLQYFRDSDGRQFFGVPDLIEEDLDFDHVRIEIFEKLKLNVKTKIFLLMGASQPLSSEAMKSVKGVITRLSEEKDVLVIDDFSCICTSTEEDQAHKDSYLWIPEHLESNQVLTMIRQHNASFKLPKNTAAPYYFVYGPDKNVCEIKVSNFLLADQALCLDGGVDSLELAIEILNREKKMTFVTHPNVPEGQFSTAKFFSWFIAKIKELECSLCDLNIETVIQCAEEYKEFHIDHSLRHVFSQILNVFLENKTWEKLNKCEFISI